MKPTRILIVDDDSQVRSSLSMFLETEPPYKVVGEASDGCQAFELAKLHHPAIILMDLSMPEEDGIEVTARIKECLPQIKVIILTVDCGQDKVNKALIDVEADGFLVKDSTEWPLIRAIEVVQQGDMFLHPRVTRQVVMTLRATRSPS